MPRIEINIEPELHQKCPHLHLGCLSAEVGVAPSPPELLEEMERATREASQTLILEDISRLPRIHATREAYKATGKKPGRYRPSAEALLRRAVSGKGLYHINNVVDVINLCSITSHFSIGGYDADKIAGAVRVGIGMKEEPYEAIARGQLNIAGLPVLRDEQGAFGSPTSDSARTSIGQDTSRILLLFFGFGGPEGLEEALQSATALLEKYCQGRNAVAWL